MTDTLLDLIMSLIYATSIAIISYYMTNQPAQTDRFIAYSTAWYLIMLIFNALGHVFTLIFYPYSSLCLLIGIFMPLSTMMLSNFIILRSEQTFPYTFMSDILFNMPMHNALVITLYGLDKCPGHTISLKLESYQLNKRHSLLWQMMIMIMHLMFWKSICLLILIYKNDITILILNKVKKFLMHEQEHEENIIYLDNLSSKNRKEILNGENEICHNVNDTLEIEQRNLNIAWMNLTIVVEKSFINNKKIILSDINGFIESGTMMALMGPSGAGKSTLLKILMGINRNLISKESKFYCNKNIHMKSCFITQDVRQQIMIGLTVEQSISYASKLKNLVNNRQNIYGRETIETLMREFAIDDIRDLDIGECSSGQQKRCVLAMELCTQIKPSVVCVDEPTSGLDSHSALKVK